ncbi:MAG: ABC transporter permease [Pseudomonadota bacterium]
MHSILEALGLAFELVFSGDADLLKIVGLSLYVSTAATLIACLIGIPTGAALAVTHFTGRKACIIFVNALMGLPPVVVGLVVYLYLSRSGPLGFLGLLYTPTAMIIAQTILIAPIAIALARQTMEDLHSEYSEPFRALGLTRRQTVQTLIWEGRFTLLTVALAGFGRAIAEVGAVMIVGGNIDNLTRVMTTSIALETSRGNLPLALALGLVLVTLALLVNALVQSMRDIAARQAYV